MEELNLKLDALISEVNMIKDILLNLPELSEESELKEYEVFSIGKYRVIDIEEGDLFMYEN